MDIEFCRVQKMFGGAPLNLAFSGSEEGDPAQTLAEKPFGDLVTSLTSKLNSKIYSASVWRFGLLPNMWNPSSI